MKDGGFSKRPHGPIPKFDARWLIGIAIVVPAALTAGVYWLHQLPAGSQNHSAGPMVEVRLVQEPRPDPAPVVAARPDQQEAAGRSEPLVAAPKKPIPEQAAVVASAPAMTPVDPAPEVSASPAPARQPSMAAGSASAFQRQLLRHIARYLRYPKSAQPLQLHGIVYVRFAMRRDGSVTEAWVGTSSGHASLDEAAIETVRRAQPLPAIPGDLPDTLTVSLPVSFDPP
jgi:protein TonB